MDSIYKVTTKGKGIEQLELPCVFDEKGYIIAEEETNVPLSEFNTNLKIALNYSDK